ncbi:hypothetical protein HAX54_037856 [Datura stramonium]|uniref:Uncharacterized protein n=1 Tax=Datura stramonium TaxID=4076 RepID=A0ABS8VIW9_DATST|nr:hypothetical protein [Datura stramonium]
MASRSKEINKRNKGINIKEPAPNFKKLEDKGNWKGKTVDKENTHGDKQEYHYIEIVQQETESKELWKKLLEEWPNTPANWEETRKDKKIRMSTGKNRGF